VETLLLATSAAAVAGGLALATAGIGQALVARKSGPAAEVILDEATDYEFEVQRPLSERLLGPAWGAFRRMGRTLTPGWQLARMRRHATLAGLGPEGIEAVLTMKAAVTVAGATLLPLGVAALGATFGSVAFWAILGGAVGFFAPDLWIARRGEARQLQIRRALPETIDLMAVAVQAGMGLEASIELVSRKLPGGLGDELHRMLQEIQLGASRRQALQRLRERTEVTELSTFALALIQADSVGSPISDVLHSQAAQMRLIRAQNARETAAKLPVKLLIPMLLFIFPALLIVVIGPAAISISEALI
jgi:tight adherence protein C